MKLSVQHCRVILLLCVLASFARLCGSELALNWDDGANFAQNVHLNPPTVSSVLPYFTRIGATAHMSIYMPVTFTVWAAAAKLTYLEQPDERNVHINPWVFHSINVIVHAMAALLAFDILRRIFKSDLPCLAGAMFFALHPIQVEPVGWASGLKDVLYGTFALLACSLHLQSLAHPMSGSGRWYRMGAILSFVLAMGSKPTGVVTPAVVFVVDQLVTRQSWKQTLGRIWFWFVLAIPFIIIARISQPEHSLEHAPLWTRPLLVGFSLSFYLYKVLVPLNYTFDYMLTPARVFQMGLLYWAWIPAAIAIAIVLWKRRTWPWLAGGGLIMLACVSPIIGLLSFDFQYLSTVANHYMYMAMFGWAVALSGFLDAARSRPLYLAVGIVLASLAVGTIVETGKWRDEITLMKSNIAYDPQHALTGWSNLAACYVEGEQFKLAEEAFHQALKIRPAASYVHGNLAQMLLRLNRRDEAIREIEAELDTGESVPQYLRGNPFLSRLTLARFYLSINRVDDAQRHYDFLNSKMPGNPQVQRLLSDIQAKRQTLSTRPSSQPTTK